MKNKSLQRPSTYSQLNLFLRSSLLSVTMITSCIFYSLVCVSTVVLPLRWRFRVCQVWMHSMVYLSKVICHIDYHVEGLQHLRKTKTAIVMSKHQSAWECFYLAANIDQPAIITKRELMWLPFFGWAFAILRPIAINRSNKKSAMQQIIQQGQRYLDQGRSVLIFPEGTRIPHGHAGHYKIGGARLSAATHYPIIPVAHNAGRFWPRRQFTKVPGTIRIIFGPPIYPKGKTPEEIIELTKNWIEEKMAEIDHF